MKKLPLHKRPYWAQRILEVGGGHDPYEGITHAVDKFPEDNTHRAGSLQVPAGVEFREGDLESVPFTNSERFDFVYASHVFEHVEDPSRAVSEINRVSKRGYLATPSPLREQIACPIPFDRENDFHKLFCWKGSTPNSLNVVKKSAERIGEFCRCEAGKFAKHLFFLRRSLGIDLEPLMPRSSKETALYFQVPLKIEIHPDFETACRQGECAFSMSRKVLSWSSFPAYLTSSRFRRLRAVLKQNPRQK
jgi:hypothetical protein